MRIALGSDHAGFDYKNALGQHLQAAGHTVTDFGTTSTTSCDYPDYAEAASRAVTSGAADGAVLVCGSGIGISIAANKVDGMRCALVHNVDVARLSKEHNNANGIAIGARFVDLPTAVAMVDTWLSSTFEPRHQRRIDKIHALEQPTC